MSREWENENAGVSTRCHTVSNKLARKTSPRVAQFEAISATAARCRKWDSRSSSDLALSTKLYCSETKLCSHAGFKLHHYLSVHFRRDLVLRSRKSTQNGSKMTALQQPLQHKWCGKVIGYVLYREKDTFILFALLHCIHAHSHRGTHAKLVSTKLCIHFS